MSNINNTDREKKPPLLLMADALSDILQLMRNVKEETLKWKTIVEQQPGDPVKKKVQGILLCGALKRNEKIPQILAGCCNKAPYLQQFSVHWNKFVEWCNDEKERDKNSQTIYQLITDLERDAPKLQATYVKALRDSWPKAVLSTVHHLELIWLAPSDPLKQLQQDALLPKPKLKPKYKNDFINLVNLNIQAIEDMRPYLLCCSNSTALWFAKTEWPTTCTALKEGKWDKAIHGFEVIWQGMQDLKNSIKSTTVPFQQPPFRPHSDFV